MINKLIESMAEVLEISTDEIDPSFDFKASPYWDSLAQISLLAEIDDEFDVNLTNDELNEANSVSDLLTTIQKKI